MGLGTALPLLLLLLLLQLPGSHCSSDDDSMTRHLLVVTASVDKMILKKPLHVDSDLNIEGAVTWVGRSSIAIQIEVIQFQKGCSTSRELKKENAKYMSQLIREGKKLGGRVRKIEDMHQIPTDPTIEDMHQSPQWMYGPPAMSSNSYRSSHCSDAIRLPASLGNSSHFHIEEIVRECSRSHFRRRGSGALWHCKHKFTASVKAAKLTGLSEEKVIGLPLINILEDDSVKSANNMFCLALQGIEKGAGDDESSPESRKKDVAGHSVFTPMPPLMTAQPSPPPMA